MITNMNQLHFNSMYLIAFTILTCSVGCGKSVGDQPDVAKVEGIVFVDGFPKENLQVVFTPQTGRPSQGVTNAEGRYTLSYSGSTPGAKVDQHKVQITTLNVSTSDRIEEQKPFKETIPKAYNTETTLTALVTSDENTIDFEIKTK